MVATDLATSGAVEGRTFFMTAWIQFLLIPAVMADRVCTPSRVWGGDNKVKHHNQKKKKSCIFHSQKVSYMDLEAVVALSLVLGDIVAGRQLDLPVQV